MNAQQQTTTSNIDLFSPIKLGPYTLPNRIVMAPLTRNRASAGNIPQAMNAIYYAQRASAGLIISEATQVSPQGVGYPSTPGVHDQTQVAGWQTVTDAVHKQGGRMFLQLWHVGRISHPSLQPDGGLPVAPSAIKPAGEAFTYEGLQAFVEPRTLETDEIPGIIGQYRQAAINAKAAGFDGVEIHAANGYLLDQFLRDGTNQRQDQYGGSVENRTRLLLEVIDVVTGVFAADQVGVRLSPENSFNDISDSDPQTTFDYVVEQLGRKKLAYLHVVEGDMITGERHLDYRRIKDKFGGLYMANSGYDYDRAQHTLASGYTDLVSFGQLFLANPDLPARFAQEAELNQPDPDTFYGGDETGYTDYPTLAETVTE